MKHDIILILDFGGQYAHLIGRRIRENRVYTEIVSHNVTSKEIQELNKTFNVKGIILSGGPASVYEVKAPKINPEILKLNLPILGLCYGHQLLAQMVGGEVKRTKQKEYGIAYVKIDNSTKLFKGLSETEQVWMSHGDMVFSVPTEFIVLAHTDSCPVAAFKHKKKMMFGVQWHPEVIHTQKGGQVLRNFIFEICTCKPDWNIEDVVSKAIKEMKNQVGTEKAIIGLSGGVDSSVATFLASRAIGKNLVAVFVDHGFMRENEADFVRTTFEKLNIKLIMVNAQERFLAKLKRIENPERKRKIIGEEFIRVFEEIAEEIGAEYLIQGTIYPDRIESGFKKSAAKIKTHHNVAGLPAQINFKGIIEPLRELYKDEVRNIAKKMDVPDKIVMRQPFPGPGLAVRIMGEVTKLKLTMLKKADTIVREEIEKSRLTMNLWQYFAVLTNTKSTGVKGDARAYSHVVAVRAVESVEAMTARFAKIPYEVLEKISTRITNEIKEVTRVVFDITNKPPSTIEWE